MDPTVESMLVVLDDIHKSSVQTTLVIPEYRRYRVRLSRYVPIRAERNAISENEFSRKTSKRF